MRAVLNTTPMGPIYPNMGYPWFLCQDPSLWFGVHTSYLGTWTLRVLEGPKVLRQLFAYAFIPYRNCNLLRLLSKIVFLLVPCGCITIKIKRIPKNMTGNL